MTPDKERVTIEALLEKGEYPVVVDLVKLGQDIKNAIYFLKVLESRVDKAVAEHAGVKIERRINGERRNNA